MKLGLRAPAKVNLSLRILGRRADGYHELRTTLLAVDLADRLALSARPGSGRVELRVSGPPGVPADASNLAARAAALVLERAGGRGSDLELDLSKEIPAAAGLGGGSSDAAAAALGAARALSAQHLDLALLVAELGSDCPFFVAAARTGLARCTGRGERVEPLRTPPPWGVLLVTPQAEASTARVYAAWRPSDAAPSSEEPEDWSGLGLAEARAALANDLEPAALRAVPELAAWRALLDAQGLAHARLAGSGSSFFALYGARAEADEAARALLGAAARAGLHPRLCRAARAAGHGARVVSEISSG
jgi:4-diphosphocytidyl-2-C-methyl-D-erythritol kinase